MKVKNNLLFTLRYEGYYCDSYKSLDKAVKIAVGCIKNDSKTDGKYTIYFNELPLITVQLLEGNIVIK